MADFGGLATAIAIAVAGSPPRTASFTALQLFLLSLISCARSSARIERQIADLEVVGSNPAGRTTMS